MNGFIIRKYIQGDEKAIEEITYRTGFKGEDLTGKNYFNDKYLFYLLFIYYYPKFEPEHCFVAEEKQSGKVIGFICGTTDTKRQETKFYRQMPCRIILRIFSSTIWRYPKTLVTLFKMAQMGISFDPATSSKIKSSYPAHLHINILQEYQHLGLGMQLIQCFENHIRDLGIKGVHLKTTSYNLKAIPFYFKAGFQLVDEVPMKHFRFKDIKLLTFVKMISS